jgi:hypothetical protein
MSNARCEGKNCYSVDGLHHSVECVKEHEESIASGIAKISIIVNGGIEQEEKYYEH